MDWREYRKLWRARARRSRAIRSAEYAAGLATLVLAPLAVFWSPLGGVIDWLPSVIFSVGALLMVLFALNRAPFEIHKDTLSELDTVTKELETVREKTKSHIRVTGVAIHHQDFHDVRQHLKGVTTTSWRGKFVKIGVVNDGQRTIRDCKAFMSSGERWTSGEFFRLPIQGDSIPLSWSRVDDQSVTLEHDNPKFFTVLHSQEGNDQMGLWKTIIPNNMRDAFREAGTYRIGLRITGEDVPSMKVQIDVEWSGTWDDVTVEISRTE